jgi:hypothetical protein
VDVPHIGMLRVLSTIYGDQYTARRCPGVPACALALAPPGVMECRAPLGWMPYSNQIGHLGEQGVICSSACRRWTWSRRASVACSVSPAGSPGRRRAQHPGCDLLHAPARRALPRSRAGLLHPSRRPHAVSTQTHPPTRSDRLHHPGSTTAPGRRITATRTRVIRFVFSSDPRQGFG